MPRATTYGKYMVRVIRDDAVKLLLHLSFCLYDEQGLMTLGDHGGKVRNEYVCFMQLLYALDNLFGS